MRRIVKWIAIGLGLCLLSTVVAALLAPDAAKPTPATPTVERASSPAEKATVGPSSTAEIATVGSSSTPRPTATPRPSSTPRPTATPAPTLTVDESLAQVAKKAMNSAPTSARITGDMAVVEDEGISLTAGLLVSSADVSFRQLAPAVFAQFSDVNLLTLKVTAPFLDKYGKESTAVALRFTITRELAAKVNWKNIGHGIGLLLATEPGCTLYVHPALQEAWAKYVAG